MKVEIKTGILKDDFVWFPRIFFDRYKWGFIVSVFIFKPYVAFYFLKDGWVELKPNDRLEDKSTNFEDMTTEEIDKLIKKNNAESN